MVFIEYSNISFLFGTIFCFQIFNFHKPKSQYLIAFLTFQKSIFLVEAKESQKELFQLQQLEIIKQGERSTNNTDHILDFQETNCS